MADVTPKKSGPYCMYLMTQRSELKRKRNKDKEVFKVVSRETIAIAVSLAINDGM